MKRILSILVGLSLLSGLNAQSLDYFADHAQDVRIGVRLNVTVVSENAEPLDVASLNQMVSNINQLYDGNAYQTIGGLQTSSQQIPANIEFILNGVVNVTDDEYYDLGQFPIWHNYGLWHLNYFGNDSDSVVDVIYIRDSSNPDPQAYGHPARGVVFSNGLQLADEYLYVAPALARVLGLLYTYGGPECTSDFGQDFIPDTPEENCDCMGSLWSYCSNNIMGNSPQKQYFSRHQVGFMRRSLLTDTICYWETDTATNQTDTTCFSFESTGTSVKQYAYYDLPDHASVSEPEKSEFRIYPNPATDQFAIESQNISGIRIIDMSGKTVYRNEKYNGGPVYHGLKHGIYFVEYLGVTKKLVISHR